MTNSDWAIACLVMSGFFACLGLVFAILKEKACCLIAGYNFKTREERKEYNERRLSLAYRNMFYISSGIFFAGAVAAYFWGQICFWLACLAWLLYLVPRIDLNPDTAFEKYRNA